MGEGDLATASGGGPDGATAHAGVYADVVDGQEYVHAVSHIRLGALKA
jgi:hypothetical protein